MVISDKVLAVAKKRLIEETAKWAGGVCQGALLHMDGKDMDTRVYTACHAWVSHAFKLITKPLKGDMYGYNWASDYKAGAKPFLVLTCHRKGSAKQESSDRLIRWLANESPFSEFVLNRDDDESLVKGGMVLLCGPGGLNNAQALWMCKVSRFTTEGNKAADVFADLVNGGVDGMLAVYVASYIRGESKGGYTFTGLEGHSTVISGGYGKDAHGADVVGMMNRKLNFKPISTMTVFETPKLDNRAKALKDPVLRIQGFTKAVAKDDGWGGKVQAAHVDAEALVANVKAWEAELQVLVRGEEVPPAMPTADTVYLEVDL